MPRMVQVVTASAKFNTAGTAISWELPLPKISVLARLVRGLVGEFVTDQSAASQARALPTAVGSTLARARLWMFTKLNISLVITSLLFRMMLAALERPGMAKELTMIRPLIAKLAVELVRSRPRQYCFQVGRNR